METSFDDLGLDPRLVRALSAKQLLRPTRIQAAAIPVALQGKDILIHARTGSGKTLAYILPILHRLLGEDLAESWQAVVLVPTCELAEQVKAEAATMALQCAASIRVTALASERSQHARRAAAARSGHIVVATPARFAAALADGSVTAQHLQQHLRAFVADEADLLLAYGYADSIRTAAPLLPRACQCALVTATPSDEVARLAALVLHNPVELDLTAAPVAGEPGADAGSSGRVADGAGDGGHIVHHVARVSRGDRLLALLCLLRLNLVRRKALIFASTADGAVRAKLLLDAFGIRTALLDPGAPLSMRTRALEQFNRGVFDILIAADAAAGPATPAADGSVARGIDFKAVRTVINLDVPPDARAYTHRVGRTGRGGASGAAVTLAEPGEEAAVAAIAAAIEGHEAGAQDTSGACTAPDGAAAPCALTSFTPLTSESLDALRYRVGSVTGKLTRAAVTRARASALRAEAAASERLQAFFETHKVDAQVLRPDRLIASAPQRSRHLRMLPSYLQSALGAPNARGARGGSSARPGKRRLRAEDDPLKGKALFETSDAPTEMELRALKAARKASRKLAKTTPLKALPKQNVRKKLKR